MQANGFIENNTDYYFSLLPSCTEVSKRGILTGHFVPFSSTNYQDNVEKTWRNKINKRIKYLPNIGALRLVDGPNADVYFLNYLPVDITLHQSESDLGISHIQSIRKYLMGLSKEVQSFSKRINAETNLKVIVLSDHGSTRIPKDFFNIQDRFYSKRALDKHHRYLEISDDEIEKLPENSKFDCFFFDKNKFDLQKNYIVAKKFYRFLPTDEHTYVHGGLSPEETIIPISIFSPITTSPKPLQINLISGKKVYQGTKVSLDLEISNYNNSPCKNISIKIIDPNFDYTVSIIDVISQLSRFDITIDTRCKINANTSVSYILVGISYSFQNKLENDEIKLPLEIEELAQTKFDLDDL